MVLKFQCPDCNEIIITGALNKGDLVRCKRCGTRFLIPDSAEQIDDKDYSPQAKPFPGILQAIGLLVLLFAVSIVVAIPIAIVGRHDAALIAPLISIGIILIYGFKKTNVPFSEVFPLRSFPVGLLVPMVLTMIGMSIIGSEIDNLFRTVFPIPKEIAAIFIDIARARIGLWRTILFAVILAPLLEEMFFRGLLLRGLLSRYGTVKAIIVSALLFALAHRSPWQFFGAAMGGTILAWWFVNTHSLLPCIFFHALNNALPLLLTTLFHIEIRGYTGEFTHIPQLQPLWFDMIGVLLTGFGIWLSIRIFSKEKTLSLTIGK